MIKNERQRRITRSEARKLEAALSALARAGPGDRVHSALHRAQAEGLRSQIADLKAEIQEYEGLRAGGTEAVTVTALEELPTALVKARIASGMTQRELAERLGLKEQQIERYEATDYGSASLARVLEVARALTVKIRAAPGT